MSLNSWKVLFRFLFWNGIIIYDDFVIYFSNNFFVELWDLRIMLYAKIMDQAFNLDK